MSEDQTPAVLQITMGRIQAGGAVRYGELEERMAERCTLLDCPKSYRALEAVAAPKEIWWFVEYATDADVERVRQAYERNGSWLSALADLAVLKRGITNVPVELMTTHRRDLSIGASVASRLP